MADGRRGSFCLHNGLLTVKTPFGSKAAQIGGLPPKVLARIMLREIAEDGGKLAP